MKAHDVLKILFYASNVSLIYRALQYNILWKKVTMVYLKQTEYTSTLLGPRFKPKNR